MALMKGVYVDTEGKEHIVDLKLNADGKLEISGLQVDTLEMGSLQIASGSDASELQITNGAAMVGGYTVKESFTSATNNKLTASGPRLAFRIWNQGTSNLTYTINGKTCTVPPNGTDSDEFDAFTEVTLSAGAVFEARLLGVRV